MKTKEVIKLVLINIIIVALFFLTVEILVRILYPDIIFLSFDRNFFAQKTYADSFSFKPDIEGYIWGKRFKTDKFGFPKVADSHIKDSDKKIIILGDSISFPVGVDFQEGFPHVLEKKLNGYRIINASIPGYWFKDYFNVLNKLIHEVNFDGVIVSICLNDSMDLSGVSIKNFTYDRDRIISTANQGHIKNFMMKIGYSDFLMRHSKAYILLKNKLFDSSKLFFMADMVEYSKPDKGDFIAKNLSEIKDLAIRNRKWIIFFVFPYRAQFPDSINNMKPQEIFNNVAKKNSLPLVDVYPLLEDRLKEDNLSPRDLYLKFDSMHFSPKGHRIIADIIYSKLQDQLLLRTGDFKDGHRQE